MGKDLYLAWSREVVEMERRQVETKEIPRWRFDGYQIPGAGKQKSKGKLNGWSEKNTVTTSFGV